MFGTTRSWISEIHYARFLAHNYILIDLHVSVIVKNVMNILLVLVKVRAVAIHAKLMRNYSFNMCKKYARNKNILKIVAIFQFLICLKDPV